MTDDLIWLVKFLTALITLQKYHVTRLTVLAHMHEAICDPHIHIQAEK